MMKIIDSHAHIGLDKDGKKQDAVGILGSMERYGIDRSVIFPFDDPNGFHHANDVIRSAVDKYPHRFIGFCRLDPTKDGAEKELLLRIRQGFRGLKLHPRSQKFSMLDPNVIKIVRLAARHKLPVLIHTEYSLYGERDYIGEFSKLAKRVRAKLIMGHSGMDFAEGFVDRILEVAKNPNVWFEISVLAPEQVQGLIEHLGAERVLFGTDSPYGRVERIEGAVQKIAKLNFEERMKICCTNLLRLVYHDKKARSRGSVRPKFPHELFIPIEKPSEFLIKKIHILPLKNKEPMITPVSIFGDFVSHDLAVYGVYKGRRLAVLGDNESGGVLIMDSVNEIRYGDERDCEDYGRSTKIKMELKKKIENI